VFLQEAEFVAGQPPHLAQLGGHNACHLAYLAIFFFPASLPSLPGFP